MKKKTSKVRFEPNISQIHFLAIFCVFIIFFIFDGCARTKKDKIPEVTFDSVPSPLNASPSGTAIPTPSPLMSSEHEDVFLDIKEKEGEGISIPIIKTTGFTPEELTEISQDGYLSYFYRRKYSKEEIGIVWTAINKLCPNYTKEDKLLALRTILNNHIVVYRMTPHHNMAANVAIAKKFKPLIEKYAKFHQVPPEMVIAVIAWENSGGIGKRSWADCVGLGQLSMGAVEASHQFYSAFVKRKKMQASAYRKLYREFQFPIFELAAQKCLADAEPYDIEEKHRKLRKKYKIDDERLIPDCNIEDTTIYLKILYNNFNQRIDLAISAYHNGGANNNYIIIDYLRRISGGQFSKDPTQKEITAEIAKRDISYITLWKDYRSREMLSGLRTVFGHITDDSNKGDALGDESDIYPWKVIAAYGAMNASLPVLMGLMKKYTGAPWDVIELRGLKTYNSIDSIQKGIKNKWLVPLPMSIISDKGIGALESAPPDYDKNRRAYNYYVTPEMAGFLYELSEVYRGRTKNPKVKIPIRGALNSKLLEIYPPEKIPDRFLPHIQGVAVDIDLDNAPYRDKLERILKEFYLNDYAFVVRSEGANRVSVNPRYGKYYYKKYLRATGR